MKEANTACSLFPTCTSSVQGGDGLKLLPSSWKAQKAARKLLQCPAHIHRQTHDFPKETEESGPENHRINHTITVRKGEPIILPEGRIDFS